MRTSGLRRLSGIAGNALRRPPRHLPQPARIQHPHPAPLALNDRLLPEGWVGYSAELTPQNADEYGYGAGFWTQRGNSAAARQRVAAGFPADSFMAIGSQGQYTIVIPSHELVIVKIGWAYTPHDDHVAAERLVRETIAALQAE